jgi:Flp pilus assembly protein TadD
VEAEGRNWEAAAADFKQVLVERPTDVKARQHLGEVLFLWGDQSAQANDFALAVRHYREALAYRPNDPELHLSLAGTLVRMGRIVEARPELEAALRIDPKFQPAQQALAELQRQTIRSKQR